MEQSNSPIDQRLTSCNPEAVPFSPGTARLQRAAVVAASHDRLVAPRAPVTNTRPVYELHRGLDLAQAPGPGPNPTPVPAQDAVPARIERARREGALLEGRARVLQMHHGSVVQDQAALQDPLIGRALDKPLIADELAEYMRGIPRQGETTNRQTSQSLTGASTPGQAARRQTRRMCPPPSFGTRLPSIIEESEGAMSGTCIPEDVGYGHSRHPQQPKATTKTSVKAHKAPAGDAAYWPTPAEGNSEGAPPRRRHARHTSLRSRPTVAAATANSQDLSSLFDPPPVVPNTHQQPPSLSRPRTPTNARHQPSPSAPLSASARTHHVPAAFAHLPPLSSTPQQLSPFARPHFADKTVTQQDTSPLIHLPGLGAHIPGLGSTQQVPSTVALPNFTANTQQNTSLFTRISGLGAHIPGLGGAQPVPLAIARSTSATCATSIQQPRSAPVTQVPDGNYARQRSSSVARNPVVANTYQHPPVATSASQRPPVVANAYQRPPVFNIAGHYPPTAEDINATDEDVIHLINEVPIPSSNTCRALAAFDIACEIRPRSPGQDDGSRYGLILSGIGSGRYWNPPAPVAGAPFRVRPRNHDGWGGWMWAMANHGGRGGGKRCVCLTCGLVPMRS